MALDLNSKQIGPDVFICAAGMAKAAICQNLGLDLINTVNAG